MRKLLFASVATAGLLAGAGLVLAQGTPGAGPEHGKGMAPAQAPAQQREGVAPGARGARPETNGQAPAARPEQPRGGVENGRADQNRGAAEEQRDQRNPAMRQSPGSQRETTGQGREEPGKQNERLGAQPDNQKRNDRLGAEPENRGANDRRGSETTGQGARGGNLSVEQRTRIRTTIMHENVRPMPNVNFAIDVGTVVPRTVELHRLPAEIVTIEPAWRGYEFFLVGDEVIVVDPASLRIIAVLPA
jgi:Protein of unknown function (DUF1236)